MKTIIPTATRYLARGIRGKAGVPVELEDAVADYAVRQKWAVYGAPEPQVPAEPLTPENTPALVDEAPRKRGRPPKSLTTTPEDQS